MSFEGNGLSAAIPDVQFGARRNGWDPESSLGRVLISNRDSCVRCVALRIATHRFHLFVTAQGANPRLHEVFCFHSAYSSVAKRVPTKFVHDCPLG